MTRTPHRGRRWLAAAAVVSLLAMALPLGLLPATTAPASAARRVPDSVCDIPWRRGPRYVKRLIRCAARRWEVPGGPEKAIQVARCESGFDPFAYGNGNAGVFQQRLVYWPERARRFGVPGFSAYNGRANVIVSVRMAHNVGWAPWSCA